jgi:hypothetical protein
MCGAPERLSRTFLHCKKSVLKIQEYIHEFFNFKLLIPEFLYTVQVLVPNCSILFYSDSVITTIMDQKVQLIKPLN